MNGEIRCDGKMGWYMEGAPSFTIRACRKCGVFATDDAAVDHVWILSSGSQEIIR